MFIQRQSEKSFDTTSSMKIICSLQQKPASLIFPKRYPNHSNQKVTGDPESLKDGGIEVADEEYLEVLRKGKMFPKEVYPMPVTTSMNYGWDTVALMRNTDRRFHSPRVVSDVSRVAEMLGVSSRKKATDKK
jgi:hypothetical protein